MGNVIAIASVVLALIAAGSIAYIAWELTSEDPRPSDVENERPSPDD